MLFDILCFPQLEDADDLLDAVDGVLGQFQKETGKRVLHDVCFY